MRISLLILLLIGLAAFEAPLFAQNVKADSKGIEGVWQGKLSVQGTTLRLVMKITKKGDALTATMDSLDQGAKDIPMDTVTFKQRKLFLELKAITGTFDGTMSADGAEIDGNWKQGGVEFPLLLKRDANVPVIRRSQEPVKPYPYVEEEVSYSNPQAAGVTLAGTLTLPKGAGPFPAVLLITGSGPQDRNEELLGHKPFLVLSDYLTRRGIAVLRVDDRGIAKSTGNFELATTKDFATDVLAGVAFLKAHAKIDRAHIGLIGHSEGGVIAPIAATQSSDIAFIVLMAGTGVNGEQILYEQSALIAKAAGAPDEAIAAGRAVNEKLYAVVRQESDPAVAAKKVDEIFQAEVKKLPEAQQKAAAAGLSAQAKALNSPWMRYFLTFEPKTALKQVKCPLLAINGEKDLQVPPKQNLPAIEAALKEGGNKDFTLKELPSLNHLFQTCKTGSPSEYSTIDETIAPIALQTMGDWILKHTAKK